MISCNINLYILIFNKQKLIYELISDSDQQLSIPYCELTSEAKIHDVLEKIFKDYVDLETFYTNFILADLVNNDILNINYFCLVPYATNIKKGHLIPIKNDKVYSPAIQKIVAKL